MSSSLFFWSSSLTSLDELKFGLQAAEKAQVISLIILSCSENDYSPIELNQLFASFTFQKLGGIYPMLINGQKTMKTGVILVGFYDELKVCNLTIPQNSTCDDKELVEQWKSILTKQREFTFNNDFLVFYDGLMSPTEYFVDELCELVEAEVNMMGGGAGSLDFISRPCIYTDEGVKANTLQLVNLPSPLVSSCSHGWEILEGPFLVSESQGHDVISINYLPASTVYQESVESHSQMSFAEHDFFTIAKNYPLGVESIQGEVLVRDPILIKDDIVQCVGNVAVNSMVYLLKGENHKLVTAAADAAYKVQASYELSSYHMTMVFDCISRVLYLEDDFPEELMSLSRYSNDGLFFGVLSLGEVARADNKHIRLLNKSTVVGCI